VIARPNRSRLFGVRVDDAGIHAVSRPEAVLDVLIDGRRIFSFWLHRDGVPEGDGHLMPWPETLRSFLNGSARVTIRVHETGTTAYDEEVTLGKGTGPIRIETVDGKPIALDKSMRRVQTFDTRSAEHVAPLMKAVDDVLKVLHELDIDAFIAYGTLLGAVRNGQLIGHDSDADLGYVSRHDHPLDVMRESFGLQRALMHRGYPVTRYSGAAFKVDVQESDGSVRGLDVFGGFLFAGQLHLMGEIRTPFKKEWVLPLGSATLEGWEFATPADTDRFLVATYGPSWRVPDPAFHFPTPRSTHRRFNGWFRGTRDGRSLWDRFYSAQRTPKFDPTDVAVWVSESEPDATQVIDLGCGYGGDVLWFARRGVRATGLDFVRRAYEDMAERAAAEGVDAAYLFFNPLELRSALSTGALIARTPGPRILYSRHLIDTMHTRARQTLWRTADMMLRDGGRMYLQFLAVDAGDKYAGGLRITPRDPDLIAAELQTAGATVVSRELLEVKSRKGASSASQICRMVVQWER
jgi:SAM-dependent methyltransferase